MSQASMKKSQTDVFRKFEDIDKNMFLKLAINDENEMNTLLSYYRARLSEFDQERQEWLEKLETLRPSQEEKHRSDWEMQKRKEEISELQKTISELKLSLFEERQQILKLKKENDLLKMKEIEDRKKIAELLSMTNSVEEEALMYKDLKPDVCSKNSKNDLNIYRNKENFDKTGNLAKTWMRPAYTQVVHFLINQLLNEKNQPRGNVTKTIYMPNEQFNTAALEAESLRNQLEEQTKLFNEQINSLKEELVVKTDEAKIRTNYDKTVLESLEIKLQQKDKHLLETTKDYFAFRVKANEKEQRLNEENEVLRLKNAALANKLMIFSKQNEIENKVSRELADKRTDEYTNKFRSQIRSKEESLQLVKNQYAKIQEIYIERIKELEENLSKLSQRYQKLEQKRALESEGFKDEIRRLKTQTFVKPKPEILISKEDFESAEKPRKPEKAIEEKKTQFMRKEANKETKSKDFREFQVEASPEIQRIEEKVKKEEIDSSIDESVNLEELENIKKQLDDLESKLDIKKQK